MDLSITLSATLLCSDDAFCLVSLATRCEHAILKKHPILAACRTVKSWLQIRLLGPYLSSFSTNSYGYYSQINQNLASNIQLFTSALIARQAARLI